MSGAINPTLHTAALAALEAALNRALDLAPGGADLLETHYRTKQKVEAPDTDHLGLADDSAQAE